MKKCALILIFTFVCVSCSKYDAPELPELNKKSFSYEEVMQKQNDLKERIKRNSYTEWNY